MLASRKIGVVGEVGGAQSSVFNGLTQGAANIRPLDRKSVFLTRAAPFASIGGRSNG